MDQDVARLGRKYLAPKKHYSHFDELTAEVAEILARGEIVGWFQGCMEYGPRALGNLSILGDPRDPDDVEETQSENKVPGRIQALCAAGPG